jgi:DNA-binding XRE family transcriptional regulator
MNKEQRERFKRAGWKLGSVGELLDLTPAEEALIEAKVRLSKVVRTLRQQSRLSQAQLAKRIGSNQTRIAKVENQDPEVSLDLQMKAIFAARPEARQEFSALIKRWAVSEPQALGPHRKRTRVRRPAAA